MYVFDRVLIKRIMNTNIAFILPNFQELRAEGDIFPHIPKRPWHTGRTPPHLPPTKTSVYTPVTLTLISPERCIPW